jgi:thioredoxin 1
MSAVVPVTDADFESDVLHAERPVLVEFWAEWCVPCRMFARILDEVAGELKDKLDVRSVNIDENPTTTTSYGVSSVPAMAVFDKGALLKTMQGARPRAALLQDLADVLDLDGDQPTHQLTAEAAAEGAE